MAARLLKVETSVTAPPPPLSLRGSSRSASPSTVPLPGCTVVDGRSTSFWFDKWLTGGTLATRFPALLSQCTRPHASVASVSSGGLHLQPPLSTAAVGELTQVLRIIDDTSLSAGADRRVIDSPSGPAFSSREAYRMLSPSRPPDASACTTCGLRLPTKLKIFAYLADIDRLSTRANLFYKHCAPSAICASCPEIETGRHLFFFCPPAVALWSHLGVSIPPGLVSIWDLPAPI
ncbi:uncharacterized protein [Lolium perenne]|uniref:uncharacterized protein n=1 Tax=Lolium perenne TaxID=4522 RepID=UPI0021F580DD|nr:uncharacterized protein LOC127336396 [Lolium perenne]